MSQTTMSHRSQLFASATVIAAAGFLTVAAPAQAHPMLPLAPPCAQYVFNGDFPVQQANGWQVFFTSTGPTSVGGRAVEVSSSNEKIIGTVSGGIQGRVVDFTIRWDNHPSQHYNGAVGDDGLVHNGNSIDQSNANTVAWHSTRPLDCSTPAAPPPPAPAQQPAPPNAQTAGARLAVSVNGPTTLAAGTSGTFNVNVSNPGDVGAPVELYVSYNGNLQQTGQVTTAGGFNCDVQNYPGGTSSVHCTVGQFGSKATATIVVQGRGSAPGAGGLDVNINSSDSGAQFVQKSQKLNVSIT